MSPLSSPDDGATEPTDETPATDDRREALVESLRAELGDALVDHHIRVGDDLWVRVATDAWQEAARVARNHLRFQYFDYLSAIDWLPSPYGKNEDSPLDPRPEPDTTIVPGYAGGETRFQVLARLQGLPDPVGLTLKADVPEDDFAVDSWVTVYPGANWHEREAHEMFGIGFRGHPNLAHLYLPGAFEGHPLRKDFPLLARHVKPWPGIVDVEPMPEEDEPDEPEATEATEEAPA